jgi:EAL domain-containing protein (putative c-di-GMP-specific phosphodiesterase class I)
MQQHAAHSLPIHPLTLQQAYVFQPAIETLLPATKRPVSNPALIRTQAADRPLFYPSNFLPGEL